MISEVLKAVSDRMELDKMSGEPFIFCEFYSAGRRKNFHMTYGQFPHDVEIKVKQDNISFRSEFEPVWLEWQYGDDLAKGLTVHGHPKGFEFFLKHFREFRLRNFVTHMENDAKFCRLIYGKEDVLAFIRLFTERAKLETDKELKRRWKILAELHKIAVPELGFLTGWFAKQPSRATAPQTRTNQAVPKRVPIVTGLGSVTDEYLNGPFI